MSDNLIIGLVFYSVFPIGIAVAVAIKFFEVRAARSWTQADATILASRVESRTLKPGDPSYDFSDTEIRHAPLVEYEYEAHGQKLRGNRITIGEKTSDYELESILQRYPVGAKVPVYYDPADPKRAVLEREVGAGVFWAGGGCVLILVALPVAAIYAFTNAVETLKPAGGEGAICIGSMAIVTLLMSIALVGMAIQASRWPTTRGRIVAAEVDEFVKSDRARRRTYFKPSVQYEYEVNGHKYLGDRVRLAIVVSSTLPGLARLSTSRYPVGREVVVYYNPKKPSESVLKPYSPWHAVPLLVALGLFAFAWLV